MGDTAAARDAALKRKAGLPRVTLINGGRPGRGITLPTTAYVLLTVVGTMTRLPMSLAAGQGGPVRESAEQLVGYAGLGASVHDSGQMHRGGRITKQGRKDLRHVLIEAAWTAVQHHPYWKREFERLTARMVKGKAIVTVARKLLVAVWYVLAK